MFFLTLKPTNWAINCQNWSTNKKVSIFFVGVGLSPALLWKGGVGILIEEQGNFYLSFVFLAAWESIHIRFWSENIVPPHAPPHAPPLHLMLHLMLREKNLSVGSEKTQKNFLLENAMNCLKCIENKIFWIFFHTFTKKNLENFWLGQFLNVNSVEKASTWDEIPILEKNFSCKCFFSH